MLRVGDLQRSIDFYTRVLGMKLLRTTERPEQKYSLAFVGYGTNPDHAESAVAVVERIVEPGDCVLVKASRSVGLERVAEALTARLADGLAQAAHDAPRSSA